MKNVSLLKNRKIIGVVFIVILFFSLLACSSTRKSPNGSYKKKKDCGCGTWTTLPAAHTVFADISYFDTMN